MVKERITCKFSNRISAVYLGEKFHITTSDEKQDVDGGLFGACICRGRGKGWWYQRKSAITFGSERKKKKLGWLFQPL